MIRKVHRTRFDRKPDGRVADRVMIKPRASGRVLLDQARRIKAGRGAAPFKPHPRRENRTCQIQDNRTGLTCLPPCRFWHRKPQHGSDPECMDAGGSGPGGKHLTHTNRHDGMVAHRQTAVFPGLCDDGKRTAGFDVKGDSNGTHRVRVAGNNGHDIARRPAKGQNPVLERVGHNRFLLLRSDCGAVCPRQDNLASPLRALRRGPARLPFFAAAVTEEQA
jgi:hypothetical protein